MPGTQQGQARGGKAGKKQGAKRQRRLSPERRPAGMGLHEWQAALRRQAGAEGAFTLHNLDGERFFGDFLVRNRENGRAYRVSIRGDEPGANFCGCPDFATNTLGVCKHLAFALDRLGRRRGARKAFQRGWRPAYSEVYLRYDGAPELYVALGSDAPRGLLGRARLRCDEHGRIHDHRRIPALVRAAERAGHECRFYDDARAHFAAMEEGRRREARLDKAFPERERRRRLRKLLRGATLLPYQCEGAWFIARTGRCLLADDMGLGKTVQAIAGTELLRRHGEVRRVLVVCPASLKDQWRGEMRRFAGWEPLVVGGLREAREAQWADDGVETKIANYEILHRDDAAIRAWSPDLLVLDEAQRIKNWATLAAQAVRRIDAPQVVVLTGTPLENRIEELHSLVEVVDRHRLGPLFAFRDRHAEYDGESGKVVGYRDLDRIGETLRPILLRRRKDEVLDQLPERRTTTIPVALGPEQAAFHEEDAATVAALVRKWNRYQFLTEQDQLRLRVTLQRMRMVCDSTYLLDPSRNDGDKIGELRALLERELADPAQKVVVFSTWLRMHELIADMLDECGWGHVLLEGGVPSSRRGDLIRRFHDDPDCRVFCSTDAGGTGLNLQCASTLVNVDLPWNPAVLEQRGGRVHRMGQQRPVRIYNLVCRDGIEGGIEKLLGFKRSVFAGVLDGGETSVSLSRNRLKDFVEDVQRVGDVVPQRSTTATPMARDADDDRSPSTPASAEPPASQQKTAASQPAGATPDLATTFQQGAAVLAEMGKLAAAMQDPRHRRRDPDSGEEQLVLPLGEDGPLAGLQRALAAFAGQDP